MKKLLLICLSLTLLMSCSSGAGTKLTDLDYIKDKGTLVVGLDDTFPPMGFRDESNAIVGFDVDVATAVSDLIGVSVKFQPIEWNSKEQELKTKRVDVLWNGLSITDDRRKNINFSTPYMDNEMTLVTTKKISSIDELAGKKLGIQGGSSAQIALDNNPDFKNSLAEVVSFISNTTALLDLETGRIDAVLMDSIVANYMKEITGKPFYILSQRLSSEQYAVGLRLEDTLLTAEIDNALLKLKENGTLSQISNKWFGADLITLNN